MANVQIENGYTKIANELMEVVMLQKFNGSQFKLILTIWRYTYGFNRKSHEFSLTFLSKATNIHKQQVKNELDRLIEDKIIVVVENSTFTKSRKLSFNKDYSQWFNLQSVKEHTVSELPYTTVSELPYTTVSELPYTTVSESTYQERKVKESIKESIKETHKQVYEDTSIYFQLAKYFYERILDNNPEHLKPNLQKWANDIRLMMERDKRSEEQIRYLIDWVQNDNFEMPNVQCPSKLRERFDSLIVKVKNEQSKKYPKKISKDDFDLD